MRVYGLPGEASIRLEHVIIDLNGTLSDRGVLILGQVPSGGGLIGEGAGRGPHLPRTDEATHPVGLLATSKAELR